MILIFVLWNLEIQYTVYSTAKDKSEPELGVDDFDFSCRGKGI